MQGNAVIVSVHNSPLTRYAAAQKRTEPVQKPLFLQPLPPQEAQDGNRNVCNLAKEQMTFDVCVTSDRTELRETTERRRQ